MGKTEISYLTLSQEDLINANAFDLKMSISAVRDGLFKFRGNRILFPEKIVQIFNEETQERINCLPATLLDEKICGVKWVSVFPRNPRLFGTQNLSAIIVLSEIEKGYPVCVMDGTLCSNMRVASVGALATQCLSRKDSTVAGFIGAGEQARMTLLGMKSVRPNLKICKVAAAAAWEEENFIRDMSRVIPDMKFISCKTILQDAIEDADIICTATSAQVPLLKAAWIKKGAFYNHIAGWEDEYQVVLNADKLVCDDWNTVKHRTQTISRCYKEGLIGDENIHGNLIDILAGEKSGRENPDEFIYFNAVGLAYLDISIAVEMFHRAKAAGVGVQSYLQESMIFEKNLTGKLTY